MKCSSQKVSRVLNPIKCEENLIKGANRFALPLLLIGRVIYYGVIL
jgi:hypothetical protein